MIPYGDYPDLSTVKRVLVIKLRHHGDVLLTTPLFSCLKKHLPNTVVDAFIYSETLPMLTGNPWIDKIHSYDNAWKALPVAQRVRRELELVREIKSLGYDLAINLTEGDRGAIAALISGASIRVGLDPGADGLWWKSKLYTHIAKRCAKPRHIVEQNIDAIRRIGCFPSLEERKLHFAIPSEAEGTVRNHLRQAGVGEGDFVAMHLTSRWLFKCWPLAKNVALIKAMQRQGIPVVLSAAPDPVEAKLVGRILEECGSRGIVNLGGKLSLKELGALIQQSKCLFTIDSVSFHLASSLKKPALALFGPSSEVIWGPWQNERAHVITADHSCRPCNLDGCGGGKVSDCLEAIPVSRVLELLTGMIS